MRLNLGIRRRLAPLLNNDRRLIALANSLLFTLPGAPIIYYGDEIGMGDNLKLPDRNGVRTPMQWDASPSAGFSESQLLYSPVIDTPPYHYRSVNVAAQMAEPGSLWHIIQRMIQLRKQHPALGNGSFSWIETGTNAVMAFYRFNDQESILAIHNLSGRPQPVMLHLAGSHTSWTDLHTDQEISTARQPLKLTLTPHQYLWLI